MKAARFASTIPVLLVVVLAGGVLLSACGGLSENERKEMVLEFKRLGDASEMAIAAKHPDDPEKRSEEFRASIESIQKDLLAKYGVTEEEAGEIFREGRQKGWW